MQCGDFPPAEEPPEPVVTLELALSWLNARALVNVWVSLLVDSSSLSHIPYKL